MTRHIAWRILRLLPQSQTTNAMNSAGLSSLIYMEIVLDWLSGNAWER